MGNTKRPEVALQVPGANSTSAIRGHIDHKTSSAHHRLFLGTLRKFYIPCSASHKTGPQQAFSHQYPNACMMDDLYKLFNRRTATFTHATLHKRFRLLRVLIECVRAKTECTYVHFLGLLLRKTSFGYFLFFPSYLGPLNQCTTPRGMHRASGRCA